MHTRCSFPLVPVPTYLSTSYKLGQGEVCHIEDAVYSEASEVEREMLIIMEENQEDSPHDLFNAGMHSSFSRLHSFELNDIGYGLNRISPITFDEDALQTPDNRTQGRAPMSMPRKKGKHTSSQVDQQGQLMNKVYPLKQAPRQDGEPRSNSYDADTLARNTDPLLQPHSCFILPTQSHPSDNIPSSSEDDSNQNQTNTTVFHEQAHQKMVSTGTGSDQTSNTGMQKSPAVSAPTGITAAT